MDYSGGGGGFNLWDRGFILAKVFSFYYEKKLQLVTCTSGEQ